MITATTTENRNVRVFNEWISAHRAHDLDALLTYVTDDITIQSAAGKNMPPASGKTEAREHWETIFSTFPDMRMDAIELVVQGDRIAAVISHGGTMKGEMGDKKPTGKQYRTDGVFRIDFQDGKIRSIRSYWDTASMLGQLGLLLPSPAPAS